MDRFMIVTYSYVCIRNMKQLLQYSLRCQFFHCSSVTPEEWEDYSDVNINKAEQERMSSKQLRSITDGILQQAANDMNKQKAETDLCFDKRIRETKETKAKLEEHLARVCILMNVFIPN